MLTFDDLFKSRGYNVPNFVLDAEGKKVQIETREDEDQKIKYQKIVNLLIGAGYYRAVINRIAPFDVIVGGMTWCIDSNDIDLDIDLLFKDSLTIGQKISLTEKIVVVLPKIKCPHFIEPHQIQGLDCIHIFPVIQWLVEWSDHNRKRKKDYLLSYALNQYNKRFFDKETEFARKARNAMANRVHSVTKKYLPVRVCKQSDDSITDILLRVEGTLAEYGLSKIQENNGVSVGFHATKSLNKSEANVLCRGLVLNQFEKDQLNFQNFEHLEQLLFKSAEGKIERLKTDITHLQREKNTLEADLEKANEENHKLQQEIEDKNIEFENLKEEEKKVLKEIHDLILTHDKLKEEKKKFKEFCKIELNDLQLEIKELEIHQGDEESEELRIQYEDLLAKLEEKKQELGKKTRIVLSKERIVDQIPSRTELSQYKTRFMELYKQVSLKHNETKQYYIMFNTVTEKFSYMEKEFKILNSIQDNYALVLGSSGNENNFIRQMRIILAGAQNTKLRVTDKRNENKKLKDNLNNQLMHYQKQQRDYISTVKQLSNEYQKLERITMKLNKLKQETEIQ